MSVEALKTKRKPAPPPPKPPAPPPPLLPTARMLSVSVIRTTIAPAYFRPLPTEKTLRAWFAAAKIPRFLMGTGGRAYYRTDLVDRWFRQRAGLQ